MYSCVCVCMLCTGAHMWKSHVRELVVCGHTHLLSPVRESIWAETKVWIPSESSSVDQWVIGVTYRNVDEGLAYLKKQVRLKDSCIPKDTHPSTGDISQSWESGAPCMAYRQLSTLEAHPFHVSLLV